MQHSLEGAQSHCQLVTCVDQLLTQPSCRRVSRNGKRGLLKTWTTWKWFFAARLPSTRTFAAEILIIYIVIQSLSKRLLTSQLPARIRNESVGTTISRFSLSKSASIRKIHEFLISIERVYLHGKFERSSRLANYRSMQIEGNLRMIGSDKAALVGANWAL